MLARAVDRHILGVCTTDQAVTPNPAPRVARGLRCLLRRNRDLTADSLEMVCCATRSPRPGPPGGGGTLRIACPINALWDAVSER